MIKNLQTRIKGIAVCNPVDVEKDYLLPVLQRFAHGIDKRVRERSCDKRAALVLYHVNDLNLGQPDRTVSCCEADKSIFAGSSIVVALN